MRVCAWTTVLLLFSSSAALAQNMGSGVKAGINFAELRVETDDEGFSSDRRTGIIGGVFFVFPVAPHFSFQFESLYAQKGAEITDDGDEGKLKIDYFQFPVLLRWDSTDTGESRLNLFAGPSFNFNHRARQESGGTDEDISDQVHTFDLGLVVGAGLEFGNFLIDGRYEHGFKEVNKDADVENFSVKHRAFSVMAGFRF